MFKKYTIFLLMVGCVGVFTCSKKKPVNWDNPHDKDGSNWHPPSLSTMDDGTVSINDSFFITAQGLDSNGVIENYFWALDGANFADSTKIGTLKIAIQDTGTHIIAVKVRDNDGVYSKPDSIILRVLFNAPKVTAMNDTLTSILDSISLTAVGTDKNGTIQWFYWAVDGSSYADSTLVGTLRTVFTQAGSYDVKVKVKDDDGIVSIADVITVTVNLNQPSVTVMQDVVVSVFDTLIITAVGSDVNGSIIYYYWALDGKNFTDSTVVGTIKTTFNVSGVYPVKVKVRDEDGVSSTTDEVMITVLSNNPRVVAMNDMQTSVFDIVLITASGSDSNGIVEMYYWALDGSTYAESTTTGSLITTFVAPGVYDVLVKARDDDGLFSNQDTVRVTISLNPPQVTAMADTLVAINEVVTLRATGTDSNGSIKYYFWARDGVQFNDSTIQGTFAIIFSTSGKHTILVKVADDDKVESNVDTIEVTVMTKYPLHLTPGDGDTTKGLMATLSWTPRLYKDAYKILFEEQTPPLTEIVASLNDTFYDVSSILEPKKTYYWQVVGVDSNSSQESGGPVWSFTIPGGLWSAGTDLLTPRAGLAVEVVNGKIYAIGGENAAGSLNVVEEYDPFQDKWMTKSALSSPRSWFAVSVYNKKLYAFGGKNIFNVEEYDPVKDTWADMAFNTTFRHHVAAATFNTKIYVMGGIKNNSTTVLSSIEEYDPVSNVWRIKKPMLAARFGLGLGLVNGILYAIGGFDDNYNPVRTVEAYDPINDSWVAKTPTNKLRGQIALSVVDNKIYAIGAEGNANVMEVYDPQQDQWKSLTPMSAFRKGFALGVIGGDIHVIGGVQGQTYVTTVEKYRP